MNHKIIIYQTLPRLFGNKKKRQFLMERWPKMAAENLMIIPIWPYGK